MTDKEIVKALECCLIDDIEYCGMCRYSGNMGNCVNDLMRDALDLINRQKAEIEGLQADYTRACAERDARICTADFFKAEAIKEFAERVKLLNQNNLILWNEQIDNLLKEMVGDNQ